MVRFSKSSLVLLAWLALQASAALGQSATPTTNILMRVSMIESRYFRGTTFSVDVDQREYWITAKHIITGVEKPPYGDIKSKSVSLRILDPGAPGELWVPEDFSVIDPGEGIDIVILTAAQPLLPHPLPSLPTNSGQVNLGGDCEFLGFPYGVGWRATFDPGVSWWMPYVKHCTISALPPKEGPKIWVLDGINNVGFSGGPVIVRTGADQRIMGVVSGYRMESMDVVAANPDNSASESPQTEKLTERPKQIVNVNSGFIIAFDIQYAVDAIEKNPIGPLRKAKDVAK
jgi:hypothetical protein